MNNAQIAEAFDLIADLLEIQAANPFRVRADRRGGAHGPRVARSAGARGGG